jgi:hypothetical protein
MIVLSHCPETGKALFCEVSGVEPGPLGDDCGPARKAARCWDRAGQRLPLSSGVNLTVGLPTRSQRIVPRLYMVGVGGQVQPVRSRSHAAAARPWPSWNCRSVGRPGGGICRERHRKNPAIAHSTAVAASAGAQCAQRVRSENLLWWRPTLHGDARQEEHQVQPRSPKPAAGPVHKDHTVGGQQDVVGPDIAVDKRGALVQPSPRKAPGRPAARCCERPRALPMPPAAQLRHQVWQPHASRRTRTPSPRRARRRATG